MASINIDDWFPRNLRQAMRAHRADEYRRHRITHSNKRFDCEIAVHSDWQDVQAVQPASSVDVTPLAIFRHQRIPNARIEVSATRLRREMTPADWMDFRLRELDREVLTGREFESPMGALPDVLSRSARDRSAVIHRTIAIKDANRLFMVETSESEAMLPRLSLQFLITLSSFKLRNPERIPTAERVRSIQGTSPSFQCVIPESWVPTKSADPLQMPLVFHNPGPDANVGELYLAVVANKPDADALFLASQYLAGLERRGVRGAQVKSEAWTGNPAIPTAQLATAQAVSGETKLDLRMAMLTNEDKTALVAMLGPARDVSFAAWAVNKRAFEIAAGSLRMGNHSTTTK